MHALCGLTTVVFKPRQYGGHQEDVFQRLLLGHNYLECYFRLPPTCLMRARRYRDLSSTSSFLLEVSARHVHCRNNTAVLGVPNITKGSSSFRTHHDIQANATSSKPPFSFTVNYSTPRTSPTTNVHTKAAWCYLFLNPYFLRS